MPWRSRTDGDRVAPRVVAAVLALVLLLVLLGAWRAYERCDHLEHNAFQACTEREWWPRPAGAAAPATRSRGTGSARRRTVGNASTGVAVFAGDHSIRDVIDPAGRIRHWSEFDRGGHFPGMEAPDLLAADVRTFFRQFR